MGSRLSYPFLDCRTEKTIFFFFIDVEYMKVTVNRKSLWIVQNPRGNLKKDQ